MGAKSIRYGSEASTVRTMMMTPSGHSSRRARYSRARGLKTSNPCWSSWGTLGPEPPRPPLSLPSRRSGFALPPSPEALAGLACARAMPGVTLMEATNVRVPVTPSIGSREMQGRGGEDAQCQGEFEEIPRGPPARRPPLPGTPPEAWALRQVLAPFCGGTFSCVVHREYKGLRRAWSLIEDSALRVAWGDGVPVGAIAAQLGRTVVSVRARAERLFTGVLDRAIGKSPA